MIHYKMPFFFTKELFTAIAQHLMYSPTFVATRNKIWFNNWSKTEKLRYCLWHGSLTHFWALRYLFQESCRSSQDCKNQSWTSDVKTISCMCACVRACVYTLNELICLYISDACSTWSPLLKHGDSPFHHLYSPVWENLWLLSETVWEEKHVMNLSAHCGPSFTKMWSPR